MSQKNLDEWFIHGPKGKVVPAPPMGAPTFRGGSPPVYQQYPQSQLPAGHREIDAALKKDPNAEPPPYAPPPCTIATCIVIISTVFARNFSTRDFAAGIVRVFQKVGLTRLDNGEFVTYTGHFKELRLQNRNIFRNLGAEY